MTGARSIAIDVAQRSTITLVIDSGKIQRIQVQGEDDEDVLELELLQPYGLTSVPPEGSEVIAVQPDGDPDQAVALAAMHPDHRPTGLEPGDVAMYRQGHGIRIYLAEDGTVHVGKRNPRARAACDDSVEAELGKIKAELTKIQSTLGTGSNGAGAVVFGTPYVNGYTSVGDVGADLLRCE